MRWVLLAVTISVALAGCAGPSQMTWMRTDGQPVDDGAFVSASAQCRDVATRVGSASPTPQRHELMVAAMQGCMARRGYAWRCQHPLANPIDGACIEM